MALFPREQADGEDFVASSDVATRALSVMSYETDFVTDVYGKLASVYDVFFGLPLQSGRLRAIERMPIENGDRILEVGTGTGMSAPLYPRHCRVTGIDLSDSMLERARARLTRHKIRNVRLLQMDAAALKFPDNSFDVVYAPYLINCVPHPIQVAQEMQRVCRPGGHIVFLNHFLSANPILARFERAIAPLTVHAGFRSDFDLPAFLAQTGLRPESIEKVNLPRLISLVICVKE